MNTQNEHKRFDDYAYQFRRQFDELGLKAPKGKSMPGLERELIVDYWRKAFTTLITKVREEYEDKDLAWMQLKDDYSEICRALGFKGDAWFGDPLVPHKDIVARAKELSALSKEV